MEFLHTAFWEFGHFEWRDIRGRHRRRGERVVFRKQVYVFVVLVSQSLHAKFSAPPVDVPETWHD